MEKIGISRCPFCAPDVNRIKFAESANFAAVYNIAPILPGHSLIVPKRHVRSVLQLSDDELCEMMTFSRKVINILLAAFGAIAFDWTIQDGEAAGQTVPHFHLHLIPRRFKDLPTPGDWYPRLKESQEKVIDSEHRPRLTPEEMDKVVAKLREVGKDLYPDMYRKE